MEPHTNMCVLQRDLPPAIEAFAASATSRPVRISQCRPAVKPDFAVAFGELAELTGFDAFVADVTELAEIYTTLMGCDVLGVRLQVLRKPMCPRFHVDRVGIRLLCTYTGPATEWLDDTAADRALLGPGAKGLADADSGLIRDPHLIHGMRPGDVALLKGELFPGNEGRGVIHRSPHGNTPRLLFSLDALWGDLDS